MCHKNLDIIAKPNIMPVAHMLLHRMFFNRIIYLFLRIQERTATVLFPNCKKLVTIAVMGDECHMPKQVFALEIFVIIMFSFVCIVALGTSIIVFCFRSAKERPNFVMWQTFFLNLYCVCSSAYIGLKIH